MIGRVFLKHLKINVNVIGVEVWFFIEVTVLVSCVLFFIEVITVLVSCVLFFIEVLLHMDVVF